MRSITSFTGIYAWLSNFAQCTVTLDGEKYPTVEHAYQAAKSTNPLHRTSVRCTMRPGEAKRIGNAVILREGWDLMRVDIMRELLKQKFAPGAAYARLLLRTGDAELIEGNWWGDQFWGQCPLGVGQNMLGKLLMELRRTL